MNTVSRCVIITSTLLLAGTVIAHHSVSTHFDMSRNIEIRGTVVDFKLRSPHASLVVDGQSYVDGVLQDETIQRWEVESSAAPGLRAMGIAPDTFKPGDPITVFAAPNRQDGFRFVNSSDFTDAAGRRYNRSSVERVQLATAATVTESEGFARMSGRWSSPGAFPLPGGTPLPLNEAGRAARDTYDARNSPANTCEPMSIPDIFLAPYLLDVRVEGNEFVVHNQPWDAVRRIPLTNIATAASADGYFGTATGRVVGTTVVVESESFPESRWGLGSAVQRLGGGADLPSSTSKKTSERFTLGQDGLSLIYHYTIEDPVYLERPYSGQLTFSRLAEGTPMYPYACDEESAAMFSRNPEDEALRVGD
jgi:hypothetical protein